MKKINSPKFLFISTAINEATYLKSIIHLTKLASQAEVIGFTRNAYPMRDNNLEINILGVLSHGNYFKRIILLITSLYKIRRKGKDFDIIYTFSFDSLLLSKLAMLFYKKKFVYHIHDIREIFIDNRLINRFARTVEKVLLKRLSCLVVSSYAFYENHFLKHYNFPSSNVFLLENKLESDPLLSTSDKLDIPIDNGTIKIGYYGVLRCNRSWDIIKTAIALAKGRLVLNARGVHDQINNFTLDVSKSENINYDGPYKGFDDLEEMYQKFDIVWAAYPFGNHKNGNWLWARTVRFYEACAFGRPVIVQANTQQAKDVLKYNIGLVVDMSNIEQAAKQILSITPEMINTWKSNLACLDRSMFIHTDEYTQLHSIIIKG